MIVGVAERLQAIDAGRLAQAGAGAGDLAGHLYDLPEAFAQLIEESRSAGHRIPQQRVHLAAVDVADHEDLQVVHVHVEHTRRAEPQGFQHAVGSLGTVARRQRQHVRRHASAWNPMPSGARPQRSVCASRNSAR